MLYEVITVRRRHRLLPPGPRHVPRLPRGTLQPGDLLPERVQLGPTGVGKTTTIAKLAANLKLRQNKKVGLITIDTYRIGAVDQLRNNFV